jgi:predicted dinucleotide-binding enzyme
MRVNIGLTTFKLAKLDVVTSNDDDAANATVAGLVDRLGFTPSALGKLDEGGLLVQARGPHVGPGAGGALP